MNTLYCVRTFGTARYSSIGIDGAFEQADQIEHVDRSVAIVVAKLCEHLLGRIDMARHDSS